MDSQNLLTESITISPQGPTAPAVRKDYPRRSVFLGAAAIILIGVSVLFHISLFSQWTRAIKDKGSAFLFSVMLPDFEISEPISPTPPDAIQLEEDGIEDKPKAPPIYSTDLSANVQHGMAIANETSYNPDLYHLLGSDRVAMTEEEISSLYSKEAPKVLIYHTHATESYCDSFGTGFRSEDDEANMVAVGEVICTVLKKAGIETIHLTEQFDKDDWSTSYENSNAAVLRTLEKYPSIQYVFDIHRDCIGNDDTGYARAVTSLYGRDTAQLMLVCGTDEGGSDHASWRDNLSFALQLQSSICESAPSLMRPINLRRASFYQSTSPAALILECGTCACTLSEAKRGAVIFACRLSDYIKGKDCLLDEEALIKAICP